MNRVGRGLLEVIYPNPAAQAGEPSTVGLRFVSTRGRSLPRLRATTPSNTPLPLQPVERGTGTHLVKSAVHTCDRSLTRVSPADCGRRRRHRPPGRKGGPADVLPPSHHPCNSPPGGGGRLHTGLERNRIIKLQVISR